jgi:hypothetical protein
VQSFLVRFYQTPTPGSVGGRGGDSDELIKLFTQHIREPRHLLVDLALKNAAHVIEVFFGRPLFRMIGIGLPPTVGVESFLKPRGLHGLKVYTDLPYTLFV